MKVLHLITTIDVGGAEKHLLELVRRQVHSGLEIRIACLKGNSELKAGFEELGAETYDLGLKFYGDALPLFRLWRICAVFRPDVLHAHLPPAEIYAASLLALGGNGDAALVIGKHNVERFCGFFFCNYLERWCARHARAVIACSAAVKARLDSPSSGILRRLEKRIIVIPYGLDADDYAHPDAGIPGERKKGWIGCVHAPRGSGCLTVGTLARLERQKSLHVLLKGFSIYLGRASMHAQLVIAGRGALEKELKKYADELGIAGHVVFRGLERNIPGFLRAVDVFVSTSAYEGFGLAILEAMAAATAVVAVGNSSVPELVEHERTGLLLTADPEKTAAELAGALLRLESPALREELGSRARENVRERFSPLKMERDVFDVYTSCIGERK